MKYKIIRAVSGSPGFVELMREEFIRIREAKRCLFAILGIEDKFDLLLANYIELERELLNLTLYQMIYRKLQWSDFRTDVELVNMRIANMLSSARLYLDQVAHDLDNLYGADSEIANAVRDGRARQYDGKLGYRTMEAVRNYIQHCGLPVHSMTYHMSKDELGVAASGIQYNVVPYLHPANLEEDGTFKRRVLAELKTRGTKIPIMPLVREYVEGLAEVQGKLREKCDASVRSSEAILAGVKEKARQAFPDHIQGLSVVSEDDKGMCSEIHQIFDDPIKRLKNLQRKNSTLNNLPARYVTSKVKERED